jgi:2-polyprenyl-3-methyl-5-hydroxy-6-metoxy-1,4-benzoquinol methylase
VDVKYDWHGPHGTKSTPYVTPMLLRELPKPPLRVLDLGCGNGITTKALADNGYIVVGVDPSASGITTGRNHFPAIRFHLDIATPGLLGRIGEKPFDAVVSSEVVEHVYDPHAWADCCAECLQPGGRLIATTPHHGYLKNLLISLTNGWDRHWGPSTTGGHIKFWSRATLSKLLSHHGFEIERTFGVGRFPPVSASLVVIARKVDER